MKNILNKNFLKFSIIIIIALFVVVNDHKAFAYISGECLIPAPSFAYCKNGCPANQVDYGSYLYWDCQDISTSGNCLAGTGVSCLFDKTISGSVITASHGVGGSISPEGSVSYSPMYSQYYSITPDAGYEITDVLVDGVSQGAIYGYAFYYIDTNHTISATFSPIVPVTVEVWADPVTVHSGKNSIIHWSSTGANYCIPPYGYEAAGQGKTGQFTVYGITYDSTFYVFCYK